MPGPEYQWDPRGFASWPEHYPDTPVLDIPESLILNERFLYYWDLDSDQRDSLLKRHAAELTVVFVRGFLGAWMPGNLLKPMRALRGLGFDSLIARTNTRGRVQNNANRLNRQLEKRQNRSAILYCGHSRGGLESMQLNQQSPQLRAKCRGIILSQTARGHSWIIDSMLPGHHQGGQAIAAKRHRCRELLQAAGLFCMGALQGAREMGSNCWPALSQDLEYQRWPFAVIQTASWSTHPTSWLDSYHQRLGALRPGVAHDGQFYLPDLIWPDMPHLLLPHLDHAQPAMGGHGFDHQRYWLSVIAMVLDSAN